MTDLCANEIKEGWDEEMEDTGMPSDVEGMGTDDDNFIELD